ncbi:MAG TPA: DUF3110 domain-containing protein [Xenococcaceae cyanobacterium]
MRVYILLFNAGTNNEGIHTIQVGDRNKILLFQEEDDALRFAMMLEAQDFPEAVVEAIDSEEVAAFCRKADYDWEIVEPGKLAIPPDKNAENPDWNPNETDNNVTAATTPEADSISQDELDSIRRRLEGLL